MPQHFDENTTDLRYPIGRYAAPSSIGETERVVWIDEIERLPATLRQAVANLEANQLSTRYRDGGWTVRQVVHHVADSHLNSYARFRLAITEDNPQIKGYDEAAWAKLPDASLGPVEFSLGLLEGLHQRWALLLRSMSETDFKRTLQHSELGQIKLDWALGLYAWHGRHHVAHISSLRSRERW